MQRVLPCLFLMLVCLLTEIPAQTVIVSPEIQLRSDVRYEVLSMRSGRTILFRDRIFEQDVLGYDENMRNLWARELSFEKKRIGIIGVLDGEEDFTLIYHFRERSSVVVMGRTYDENANLISSDTLWVEEGLLNSPEYYLSLSDDRRFALIFKTKYGEGVTGYGLNLDSMKVEWKNKIKVDDFGVKEDFIQAIVANDGRSFLVYEKDNRWTKRRSHRVQIYPFDHPGPIININASGRMYYDIFFQFNDKENKVVGAASYSERSDSRTDGIISYTIELDRQNQIFESTYRFDEKILQDIYGKKVNKNKGLKDVVIRHIQPRADGGVVILGELSKEYSRRPSFSAAPASSYTRRWVDYYFEEIIAVSVHPDGKMHWVEVLHKRQYSQDDDAMFSSFFVFELPSQLRILFNDEIRSENTVSEYIVTGKGLEERKSLMSTDYQNLKLRFREAKQTGNQSLIVPSLRGNRLALVKIDYSET